MVGSSQVDNVVRTWMGVVPHRKQDAVAAYSLLTGFSQSENFGVHMDAGTD